MGYDHRCARDLIALRNDLNTTLDAAGRTAVLAELAADGWLTIRDPALDDPTQTRAALDGALRRMFGHVPDRAATVFGWALCLARRPEVAAAAWRQLTDHLVAGRDRYDPASAGGLCAQELDRFIALCIAHGWVPPREHVCGPGAALM